MQNDKRVVYQNVEFIDSKGKSSFRLIKLPLIPYYRIPILPSKGLTMIRNKEEEIEPTYIESETYLLKFLLSTHKPQYVEESWYERALTSEREAKKLRDYRSTESRLDRIEKLLFKIINPKADE